MLQFYALRFCFIVLVGSSNSESSGNLKSAVAVLVESVVLSTWFAPIRRFLIKGNFEDPASFLKELFSRLRIVQFVAVCMRELGCEIRLLVETRFEHWHVTTSNITSLKYWSYVQILLWGKKKTCFWWLSVATSTCVCRDIDRNSQKKKKVCTGHAGRSKNTAKNWKFLDASCPILELEVTAHHNLIQTPWHPLHKVCKIVLAHTRQRHVIWHISVIPPINGFSDRFCEIELRGKV